MQKTTKDRMIELVNMNAYDLRSVLGGYEFPGDYPPTRKELSTLRMSGGMMVWMILEHEGYVS